MSLGDKICPVAVTGGKTMKELSKLKWAVLALLLSLWSVTLVTRG